ncbi:MAG: fimbrillin family protein [Bacteroidales bacterium]|nr:fimbrillin family protein [Bacteroidales bacterium]
MSQVTFNIKTSDGADKVDLTNVQISIADILTQGTIDVADGSITPTTDKDALTEMKAVVIPQSLTDKVMKITLEKGATYKLNLTSCVTTTQDDDGNDVETPITEWERGKSYTYNITVVKEAILFKALIKEWEETTGSGNAELEWD